MFIVFFVVVGLVPAVVLVLCGVRVYRRAASVGRVAVQAFLVDSRMTFTRTSELTFDYPGPDGRWLRATRLQGLPVVQHSGWFMRPGDRLTVFVDPNHPLDVTLGQAGSASGGIGIAMIVVGAFWGLSAAGLVLNSMWY